VEYWNGGVMVAKEEKQLRITFSAFTNHSSILASFHERGKIGILEMP
jgi:hypothetical protein